MAKIFVNTFKRDYVSRLDLQEARTLLAQLPSAFAYLLYNNWNSAKKGPNNLGPFFLCADDQRQLLLLTLPLNLSSMKVKAPVHPPMSVVM